MNEIGEQSEEAKAAKGLTAEEREKLKSVVDVFTRLAIACKSRSLYPSNHPAAVDSVSVLYAVLSDSLEILPEITVKVGKESLLYDKWSVGRKTENLRQLAHRIRSLNIQDITFRQGATIQEVASLVDTLVMDSDEVEMGGGAQTILFVKGVKNVLVTESIAQKIDEEEEEEVPEEEGEEEERVPLVLDPTVAEFAGRLEELLELVMDPEELALTLLALRDAEEIPLGDKELADAIFHFLKSAAAALEQGYPDRGSEFYRGMAESLLFLETDLRNLVLVRQMFPNIREEPAAARILGQFNIQEMVDVLSYFFPIALELVPRARGMLALVGFNEREVESSIGLLKNRLIDLGEVPPSLIAKLDTVAEEGEASSKTRRLPTFDDISALYGDYQADEMEEIRRIAQMDLWKDSLADTTPMLLDLLKLGSRLDNLDKAVGMVTQFFWDLLESGQIKQAAAILERANSILGNGDPAFEPYKPELANLAENATGPDAVGRVVRIAHRERSDPDVVEGFRRYLSNLGERGICSMVEVLGTEEKMSVRKYICDVLVDTGTDNIRLLGSYINDPRWYLVRNVVSIIGRTHSPEAMPYLQSAFYHENPKVRAETIRALGLTGTYEARDLLMQGLDIPDEQTRVLCIRWLGRLGETRAVGRLAGMLEGKDPGADSLEVKKEILQSLGRIDNPDVYATLRKYSHQRKLLNRSEWQEINDAASEAMRKMEERFPHLRKAR